MSMQQEKPQAGLILTRWPPAMRAAYSSAAKRSSRSRSTKSARISSTVMPEASNSRRVRIAQPTHQRLPVANLRVCGDSIEPGHVSTLVATSAASRRAVALTWSSANGEDGAPALPAGVAPAEPAPRPQGRPVPSVTQNRRMTPATFRPDRRGTLRGCAFQGLGSPAGARCRGSSPKRRARGVSHRRNRAVCVRAHSSTTGHVGTSSSPGGGACVRDRLALKPQALQIGGTPGVRDRGAPGGRRQNPAVRSTALATQSRARDKASLDYPWCRAAVLDASAECEGALTT
jgi:hypothetical protein